MNQLSALYAKGSGVKKSFAESMRWFNKAVALGHDADTSDLELAFAEFVHKSCPLLDRRVELHDMPASMERLNGACGEPQTSP